MSMGNVEAAPKKYSNCTVRSSIKSPPGSSGYYMSADCNKAYILPPEKGYVEYSNIVSSLDSSLCQGTQGLLNFITQSMGEIEQIRNEISKEEESVEKNDHKLRDMRSDCDRISEQVFSMEDRILITNGQLSILEGELQKLEKEKINCEKENGTNSVFCTLIGFDIEDVKEKISKVESILNHAKNLKETNESRLDLCEKRVELWLARSTRDNKDYKKLKQNLATSLMGYQRLLNQQIDSESSEVGGVMGVNFLSAFEDLRTDFVEANTHLTNQVEFVQMPLKSTKISFQLIENGKTAGFPVILQSHINGLSVHRSEDALVSTDLAAKGVAEANKFFGQGVGGNIVLNRLSVCKMARQKGVHEPSHLKASDIASLLKPTVSYEYELQADRNIKVAFEENHFYQLIHKNINSKSGLFKTRTLNSLFEQSEASKWIDIEITSQDGDHKFVDPVQMALDFKKELADAALTKVAKSYLSSEQVALLEGGVSAAEGASKIVKECPHSYCRAAGMILDLGSALFGGSVQEANMIKIVKAKEKIEIRDSKMSKHSNSQVFEPRGI